MPIPCPTCSKINPSNATYCYYDGRTLAMGSQAGPLAIGTLPFPMPFCFSDGQSCANFNQLALACNERWNEARRFLSEGIWQSFFTVLGRLDLATAAQQAAREPDFDVGLTHLLEKFPADADALRPPKLSVPSAEENLGTLEPGKDHKFEVEITNQGMLVLRGLITTDCDWLCFGEHTAGPSSKMFQTRHKYTLPVRVLGDKLRAGRKPLKGQIVIDTNGGCITFPVRATVPVRPFPKGQYANDVLAGAKSPHEIAVKAKAHPEEAAVLFEQGAVKAWYASNGWTYPIQGTEGTGKGAVQQFFEVLGLTKPPRLEISAGKIVCKGKVGERLTKYVTISTKESRFVYAQGWSNHDWIQARPGKSQGNTVTIPLSIEVPPRPGETVTANVTIQGNGKQQFVVPVTLAVAGAKPVLDAQPMETTDKPDETTSSVPLGWIFAGVAVLLLIAGGAVALVMSGGEEEPGPPPLVFNPPPPPPPKNEAWWDSIPDSGLAVAFVALKESMPQHGAVLEGIAAKSDVKRYKPYEQLETKLSELADNAKDREPLGRFLEGCCVFEPSDLNIKPLRRALAGLLPRAGDAFRPEEKGQELERASFALHIYAGSMSHKAIRPGTVQDLANDLGRVFGVSFDSRVPPEKFKSQLQKALAEQCYRNTLPTARKSFDYALVMRGLLIEKYSQHLAPALRAKVDVDLIAVGLSQGDSAWPKLEPILKTSLESTDVAVGWKILDIYEQAKPDLAEKLEKVLVTRWKAAANPKLTHAEKAAAFRKSLVNAKISPEERRKQLQKLAAFKPGQKKEAAALLQDTVRLAHASTMASILFREDGEVAVFDELVGKVPEIARTGPAKTKPPDGKSKPAAKGVIIVGPEPTVMQGQLTRDPRRGGVFKVVAMSLKAGQLYNMVLTSRSFAATLRLEGPSGEFVAAAERSIAARIVFTAPADGVYRLTASTLAKGAAGSYTLVIQERAGFAGIVPFPFVKGPGIMPEVKAPKKTPKTIDKKDLDDLDNKQSQVRVAAFKRMAENVSGELSPRHARKIAAYLLSLKNDQKDELAEAVAKLDSFRNCRQLLLALADHAAKEDVTQQTTETIVGGLLGKSLRFARDEDWRTACRTMLLQRALDLTGSSTSSADQAAKILGELYKEQGLAFGIDDPEFLALTRPTQVLESVIKHVAAKAGKQNSAAGDKEYLEQIGRHLQAAQFVAENDLEYMVLLQRHWLKVLSIYLQEKAPAHAKGLTEIQHDLAASDRQSRSVLDQLRAGEEKILGVWVLAYQLK